VRQEPKLEKRSELAMEVADQAVDKARKAYDQGRFEETVQALTEVQEAVDLSYESLVATGKNPRKDSKYFKRAEKATRDLLRRLSGLRDLMISADYEIIDPVIERANSIQDNLVTGVLTGKR
jgi:hypothetical protein